MCGRSCHFLRWAPDWACSLLGSRKHVGAEGEHWDFNPIERVLIAGRALWFYATKLGWPHPLIFIPPRWTINARQSWQYLYPVAALGIVVFLWLARRKIGAELWLRC